MEKKKEVKKLWNYDENFNGEILKMIESVKNVQDVARTFGIGETWFINGVPNQNQI